MTATASPSAANARAMARPMPRLPPVTRTLRAMLALLGTGRTAEGGLPAANLSVGDADAAPPGDPPARGRAPAGRRYGSAVRAVQITEFGGPEVLPAVDVEAPQPQEGRLLDRGRRRGGELRRHPPDRELLPRRRRPCRWSPAARSSAGSGAASGTASGSSRCSRRRRVRRAGARPPVRRVRRPRRRRRRRPRSRSSSRARRPGTCCAPARGWRPARPSSSTPPPAASGRSPSSSPGSGARAGSSPPPRRRRSGTSRSPSARTPRSTSRRRRPPTRCATSCAGRTAARTSTSSWR